MKDITHETMEIKETSEGMEAVVKVIDKDNNIIEEVRGHFILAAIIKDGEDGTLNSSVMTGPIIRPSELVMATTLILHSAAKVFRQLNIMDQAEEVLKKALEMANDLSE